MIAGTASENYFSHTYADARRRFMDAAHTAGAQVHSYTLGSAMPDALTIDVAIVGADHAPAMVVSSGVHGIECFFGSAVQLALLERLAGTSPQRNIRYVLIHGVNPFGFKYLRRVNEDNVDLNRNFVIKPGDYAGAPGGYAGLNGFLNPPSAPSRFEPFRLKALWNIWRMGFQAVKDAVAGGQYEYPRGLFYGGAGPCASTRIVQDNCDAWLAASQHVVHIDLHTGLGAFATPTLLLNESSDAQHYAWYAETFDAGRVQPLAQPQGPAYRVSGTLGQWMQHHFNARDYRFVGAEFGTYDVIRVLAAIRAENRAHHYCAKSDAAYLRAQKELRECFCPESPDWRSKVVESALRIIDQGAQAISVRQK